MSDGYVQVPPDGGGKRVDAEQLVVNGQVVHRQRMEVAGVDGAAIAQVVNGNPGPTAYGLVTRAIPAGATQVVGKSLTIGTSAVQLPAFACFAVVLMADPRNTVPVWLGGSDVAVEDGLPLFPGSVVTISVDNASRLHAIAETAGQKLHRLPVA